MTVSALAPRLRAAGPAAANVAAANVAAATAPVAAAPVTAVPAATAPDYVVAFRGLGIAALAATALFLTGLAATRALLGEAAVIASMASTFEAGGVAPGWLHAVLPSRLLAPAPHWDTFREADAGASVLRPELIADLAGILRPRESKQYVLVVGESGTGKSTAVRSAARSLPQPSGCVYFSAPELAASFSTGLALAVGFFRPFEPLASFYDWWGGQRGGHAGPSEEPGATWAALREALLRAAAVYRARHGRPAVLVIDAADYVAKKRPDFFGDLQDFAKVCADAGSLRVVFVSSEGVALPLMRASSAWSRSLKPPYEVRDIADGAAREFLVSRGVDDARGAAGEAVHTVAGGRFALLLDVASAAAAGKNIAAIRGELHVATSAVLKGLGLAPGHALFRELVAHGRVMSDAALDLAPADALAALLRANILALHPDGGYSFHARHVESFFRERGAAAAPAAEADTAAAAA